MSGESGNLTPDFFRKFGSMVPILIVFSAANIRNIFENPAFIVRKMRKKDSEGQIASFVCKKNGRSRKSPWMIVKHAAWEVPLKGDLEGLFNSRSVPWACGYNGCCSRHEH